MPVDTLLDARSLADLSPIALLVIDDRRRIVDGNPAAEALFQLSRRSLTNKPLSELIYHDSRSGSCWTAPRGRSAISLRPARL